MRNKSLGKKIKIDKRFIVVIVSVLLVVAVGLAAVKLFEQYQIAKTDVTLEELCDGGAKIYDAEGELYTRLDIKLAAGWLTDGEIPTSFSEIDTKLGKTYGELIVSQFFPEEKNKNILAKSLEQRYSQQELENFFLNTVYLGDGVYGLSNASKYVFAREWGDLSQQQKQTLADKLIEYLSGTALMDTYEDIIIYEESGYLDGVVKETAKKLMEAGKDELVAYNTVFFGDISIYTYLNQVVQSTLDSAYSDRATFTVVEKDYDYIQSAMVIMDYEGHVQAVASGNNKDKIFNRALSRNYQVGSTIKPVSTYALGIETGKIHFSSLVENRQEMIRNSRGEEHLWPSNSDREYGGRVLVTRALQESKNTVAVQIGHMVGEERMYDFLKNTLGFDLIYYEKGNSDVQLSALTLGYFYNGITLNKLVSSYEIFANKGKYLDSTLVQKVVLSEQGEIIASDPVEIQAISQEAAYITNRLLYNNVNGEYGIARAAKINGREVLGKTGTIGNDDGKSTSRLFVGITGDYIAGVWIGFDTERALHLQSYYNPDEIFSNIMARMPHSNTEFQMPEGVVMKAYCEHTGDLATEQCPHTEIGYYTMNNLPEYCASCGNNK